MKRAFCRGKPVSAKQLKMGIRVEREHRKHADPRRVACDHLLEFGGFAPYYTELRKMEKKLKRRRP